MIEHFYRIVYRFRPSKGQPNLYRDVLPSDCELESCQLFAKNELVILQLVGSK